MDEITGGSSRPTLTERWRALSPWTQYLLGCGLLCTTSLIWSSVPPDWGVVGAGIRATMWIAAPIGAVYACRDVFAHAWDRPQIPQAVWVGVAAGVLICVPTGSVPQALIAGPLFGAVAWVVAELGLRDRWRRLPPPPLPPPPHHDADSR